VNCSNSSIPLLVHTHFALDCEDLPFWLDQAQLTGGPILELGCGTGRVSLRLAEAGFTVVGLDHDLTMLAFLKGHMPAEISKRVHLLQADLADFHFSCHFPLILLPCNTLSTLWGARREALFERVAEHLTLGGAFAASIPNPQWLADLPAQVDEEVDETLIHPETGNPLQISSSWEHSAESFSLRWHYDHLLPDGQVERITLETTHVLDRLEEYQAGLEGAGLAIEAVYGDFERSEYTTESPNLILVVRIPG
jgi:SAM-dependent methyltransferase